MCRIMAVIQTGIILTIAVIKGHQTIEWKAQRFLVILPLSIRQRIRIGADAFDKVMHYIHFRQRKTDVAAVLNPEQVEILVRKRASNFLFGGRNRTVRQCWLNVWQLRGNSPDRFCGRFHERTLRRCRMRRVICP